MSLFAESEQVAKQEAFFAVARTDNLDQLRSMVEVQDEFVLELLLDHKEVFYTAITHDSQRVLRYLVKQDIFVQAFTEPKFSGSALMLAIMNGASSCVGILIDNGANPNNKARPNPRRLFGIYVFPIEVAARYNNLPVLKKLVEKGANVNSDSHRVPPLCEACEAEGTDLACLDFLLDSGADINNGNLIHEPPLTICLRKRKMDVAQYLLRRASIDLEKRHDIYSRAGYGLYEGTLLARACLESDIDAMEFLLSNGADINTITTKEDGANVSRFDLLELHTMPHMWIVDASKSGDVCKVLVKFGLDLNKKNPNGHTYLMKAAIKGGLDVAMKLVELGVNINEVDLRGVTALTHASRGVSESRPMKGHLKLAKYLAGRKANGDEAYRRQPVLREIRDSGTTKSRPGALHESLESLEKLSSLIHDGEDVDAEHEGYTPLGRACKMNFLEAVRMLALAGASIEKPYGDYRYNPLITASSAGNQDIIELLLKRGADVTYKSLHGHALMVACFHKRHRVVKYLIEAGIDIDDANHKGFTCAHVAVINGDLDLLKMLIEQGARVNVSSSTGVTPWMLAKVEENIGPLQLLVQNGAIISSHFSDGSGDLGQTFTETGLLLGLESQSARLGRCEYIDHILLEDGRCLHFATRAARRVLMRLLNAPVDADRFILPLQLSGTCWFHAMLAMMFLSDLAREHTLPLRRSMIMGRTSVNGDKFPESVSVAFMKMNIKIQAIISGNTGSDTDVPNVMLPIVNNEDVVLGLADSGITTPGLNCGATFWEIILTIEKIGDYLYDGVSLFAPSPKFLLQCEEYVGQPFEKKVNGHVYVVDSIGVIDRGGFGEAGHIVSGLTLDGERYIYDSNVGRVQLDWKRFFEHEDEIFEINDRKYSFNKSRVMVMYCLVLNP